MVGVNKVVPYIIQDVVVARGNWKVRRGDIKYFIILGWVGGGPVAD